jgi:hypothetical protein
MFFVELYPDHTGFLTRDLPESTTVKQFIHDLANMIGGGVGGTDEKLSNLAKQINWESTTVLPKDQIKLLFYNDKLGQHVVVDEKSEENITELFKQSDNKKVIVLIRAPPLPPPSPYSFTWTDTRRGTTVKHYIGDELVSDVSEETPATVASIMQILDKALDGRSFFFDESPLSASVLPKGQTLAAVLKTGKVKVVVGGKSAAGKARAGVGAGVGAGAGALGGAQKMKKPAPRKRAGM